MAIIRIGGTVAYHGMRAVSPSPRGESQFESSSSHAPCSPWRAERFCPFSSYRIVEGKIFKAARSSLRSSHDGPPQVDGDRVSAAAEVRGDAEAKLMTSLALLPQMPRQACLPAPGCAVQLPSPEEKKSPPSAPTAQIALGPAPQIAFSALW